MGNSDDPSPSPAKDRLAQVQNHLSPPPPPPNTPQRRRRSNKSAVGDQLPADYSDILGQISTLKQIAATPDTSNRGYVRQKAAGKLWVRERVEAFVDAGSFREVGSVSGTVTWRKVGEKREEPVECKFLLGRMIVN
jgi:hypothetical protein